MISLKLKKNIFKPNYLPLHYMIFILSELTVDNLYHAWFYRNNLKLILLKSKFIHFEPKLYTFIFIYK